MAKMTGKTLVQKLIETHVMHPDFVEDHPRAIGRKELLIDAIQIAFDDDYAMAVTRLEKETQKILSRPN